MSARHLRQETEISFSTTGSSPKKAQTQSTVAGDAGTTLVTKDYLDTKISTISLTPGPAGARGPAGPAGPAGVSPSSFVALYNAPSLNGGSLGGEHGVFMDAKVRYRALHLV